jgi:hypothetical protein
MKLARTEAAQLLSTVLRELHDRTGYANGFKNKSVLLANGKVLLEDPAGPWRP